MPSEHNGAFRNSLQQGLSELEARSQRRSLAEIAGVNLCSNDYLGLGDNAALRAAIVQAVRWRTRCARSSIARDGGSSLQRR